MANIREKTRLKNGVPSFEIRISMGKDSYTGKYQYHTESFRGSKKDARIRAKELEVQVAKDQLYQSEGVSCEYLVQAFMDYKRMSIRKRKRSFLLLRSIFLLNIGFICF